MSGQETGGQELRERIVSAVRTHAIDSARNDRAQDADYCLCGVLVEDWDEHWTDAALTLVQPELAAKDAQIERLAEEREQYQRAAKIFKALRLVLDTGQAPSEWAKPWRDRAETAEAELKANAEEFAALRQTVIDHVHSIERLRIAWASARTGRAAARRQLQDGTRTLYASLVQMHIGDVVDERDRLRDLNEKLSATIAAFPDAHNAANIAHARRERDRLRAALQSIGTRCETSTGPSTCLDDPGRSPDGTDMVSRWCDGCIARAALEQPGQEQR